MKIKTALLITTLMMPLAGWTADSEKARIITSNSDPVRCLAAISVTQVDGRNRQLPSLGFEIEPGEHSLHGRATLDLRNCPPSETGRRNPVSTPPLDWFFEAGKVYYVALDYSSPQRENWKFVVWKTEYADGEVIFDITRDEAAEAEAGKIQ